MVLTVQSAPFVKPHFVLTAAIAAVLLIGRRSANPYVRSRKNASILPALEQWIAELLLKKPSALLIFINRGIIMVTVE